MNGGSLLLSRETENRQHCCLGARHIGRRQMADDAADAITRHRDQNIGHEFGWRAQAIAGVGLDAWPERRAGGFAGREKRKNNAVQPGKCIPLNDKRGAWFAAITATGGNGDGITAFQALIFFLGRPILDCQGKGEVVAVRRIDPFDLTVDLGCDGRVAEVRQPELPRPQPLGAQCCAAAGDAVAVGQRLMGVHRRLRYM
jgi:hypothetical protein